MKNSFLILSLVLLLDSIEVLSQTENPPGTLTFHITGFENNTGQTLVLLYRKENKVPKNPFMQLKAEILNKESVVPVKDLPFGEYAAIVVHDQNKNGTIDHKWGFPAEPLGYTNNWKLSLFSGMPAFEKLRFLFSRPDETIVINMAD